jgi:hypothetical protein
VVESSGTLRDADLREEGIPTYARVSGLAVASLVSGVLGCLFVPAGAALVFGVLAVRRIRQSKGALVGTPLAVAGIVIGVLMVAAMSTFLWYRADVRARGIEQSRTVVAKFFDSVERGFHDDAYALCAPGLKQEVTPQILKNLQTVLVAYGKVQAVTVESGSWKRSGDITDVAEMTFVVRTPQKNFRYVISTAPYDSHGQPINLALDPKRMWQHLGGRDEFHWIILSIQEQAADAVPPPPTDAHGH